MRPMLIPRDVHIMTRQLHSLSVTIQRGHTAGMSRLSHQSRCGERQIPHVSVFSSSFLSTKDLLLPPQFYPVSMSTVAKLKVSCEPTVVIGRMPRGSA